MEIQRHSAKVAATILIAGLVATLAIGTYSFASKGEQQNSTSNADPTPPPKAAPAPNVYPDPVPEPVEMTKSISTWAKADVEKMIADGMVPESLQGNYQSNLTRQEYTLLVEPVLHHITGKEEALHKVLPEHRFDDSFEESIYEAYVFGIINGVSDKAFEPKRNIERGEAVTMMGNILTTLKVSGLSEVKAPYVDYSVIPSWAQEAADITYNAKIFQGSTAGMEPDKFYTREQAIVTMKRLVDFVTSVEGISYRGKVFIKFDDIDDVHVGSNFVKIGSPKGKANFNKFWQSISSNFMGVQPNGSSTEKLQSGEFTIETFGEDYLIKISW